MGKCPDCGLGNFSSKGDLRSHRRQAHGFVKCDCGREFLKREYMEQHIRMSKIHRNTKSRKSTGRFQCSECSRRFLSTKSLTQHQMAKNHEGINEIGSEGNEYSSSFSLYERNQGLTGAFGGLHISTPSVDVYTQNTDTLERFVAENIQADSLFLGCCGEVINDLVRKLQDKDLVPTNIRPRGIIKSGSLGKGTAVKDRSDIDLILMLVKYDNVEVLMRDMSDLLSSLERHLKVNTTAKHQRTTRYSVQVELSCCSGHKHDVDILPAVDLLDIGYSPADVYMMMEGVSSSFTHEYSEKDEQEMPSFAEKRYGKPNWPSSYALELVVMNAWTEANEPVTFDMTRALHAVLTSLVNHRQFKIILRRKMKYNMTMLRSRSTPYIMDPANPYNDMYHGLVGGQAFDWDRVVPEARLWLSKPLFYGVSNTEHRWK